MAFTRFDHVQLAMPPGAEGLARQFYMGVLGFEEVSKPTELASRGGAWFRCGEVRLHLGVEIDFHPAQKAHPALRCSNYDSLLESLRNRGITVVNDDLPFDGARHCYAEDPFGNRLEFIAEESSSSHAAGEAAEWFLARSRERKPWKTPARELIVERRRE